MLEFDKSFRFMRFVTFLAKRGIVKLNSGVPSIQQRAVMDAIGLAFFVHYVARGLTPTRRITFVPVSTSRTALLVEPLPHDDGIFLRGPLGGDYAPRPLAPTMRATDGLCPGRAFVHANWATYMAVKAPRLPTCNPCPGDACATAAWVSARLGRHPGEALGLVGGHALVLDAPPEVFALVGTEPVVSEDDPTEALEDAKRLDMKYFDAYLTLDLAARAKAKVYIPNTQLRRPVVSPYECDVVVYDRDNSYLAIVETAMGVGPDEEAIQEEKEERGVEGMPALAVRMRRKYASHAGLAALRLQRYRYVYASVGKLDFATDAKQERYTLHLMAADPPMKLVVLQELVPDVLRLREPRWWDPAVLKNGFREFRRAIREATAL